MFCLNPVDEFWYWESSAVIQRYMLFLASTTKPIQCCIGLVVEAKNNKSVIVRVCMVDPAFLPYLALSVSSQHSLLCLFGITHFLALRWKILHHISSQVGTKHVMGIKPCITRLSFLASSTKPIRRPIGPMVEAKSVAFFCGALESITSYLFSSRTKLVMEIVPCISCLLFLASTTKPIRHCIGSVVEAKSKKRATPRVHTVGPAISTLYLALSIPISTLPSFAHLAILAFWQNTGKCYLIFVLKREPNL
jgi:hypothetical protein